MKSNNLPVFGIGPIYVVSCLVFTLIGLALNYYGVLNHGKIPALKIPMLIVGSLMVLSGIVLWVNAVIIQKIGTSVKEGKLITTGVYALVRNPIYSAFIMSFTGILVAANNWFLLVLPLVFWAALTVLLKQTEEKWLLEKFGEDYIEYCRQVNRIIPSFSKRAGCK